jgi:hypothetical protein
LDRRDYCVHGAAFTADDLQCLADECEDLAHIEPDFSDWA